MRILLALAALLLAGCAQPAVVQPEDRPDGIWMTHTIGCGFCGDADGAWARTLVVYGHGDPLWFTFRPDTGYGDPVDGIEMPPGQEAHRGAVEAALARMRGTGSYHAQWAEFEIHDLIAPSWSAGQRGTFEARIAADLPELATPPRFDNDCEDYGFPHVSVWRPGGVLGGDVPGHDDPCAGDEGPTAWRSISSDLRSLHDDVRPG